MAMNITNKLRLLNGNHQPICLQDNLYAKTKLSFNGLPDVVWYDAKLYKFVFIDNEGIPTYRKCNHSYVYRLPTAKERNEAIRERKARIAARPRALLAKDL